VSQSTPDRLYDREFYAAQFEGSLLSARKVVPKIIELIGSPARVLDVGCGTGAWLSVFLEHGVPHVAGIDGGHVDLGMLAIPRDCFRPCDLERPLPLSEPYDLAICLEVAEHLPKSAAGQLVASLTARAPVVLFSAAIPGQGGTHHVNEQWPEYWTERFAANGFTAIDCLRHVLWQDTQVQWWYAQNMIFYVKNERLSSYASLADARWRSPGGRPLSLVHPRLYLQARTATPTLRKIVKTLPGALYAAIRFRAPF